MNEQNTPLITPTLDTTSEVFGVNSDEELEEYILELVPIKSSLFEVIRVGKEKVHVGRKPEYDRCCRFDDARISTTHCEFEQTDGVVYIKDVSTNGTYINSKRLVRDEKVALNHGDELSFVVQTPNHKLKSGQPLPSYIVRYTSHNDSKKRKSSEKAEDEPAPKKPKTDLQNDDETKRILALFGAGSQDDLDDDSQDELNKELTCPVCADLFYKPLSVLPCLHNFCSPCLSDWDENNDTCPTCRIRYDDIRKNHNLNNLVEAYLKTKPSLNKSQEIIQQLESRIKLTDEELLQRNNRRNNQHSDEDEEDNDEDQDDDDDEITCNFCSQVMTENDLRCDICSQVGLCTGCGPRRLTEHQTVVVIPTEHPILRNRYEREIILSFMSHNNVTPQELYNECIRELMDPNAAVPQSYVNNHHLTTVRSNPDLTVCKHCIDTRIFPELVYQYRARIPNERLPATVTARPNCWYGRECNTMVHNTRHAQNFNHVCENVRTRQINPEAPV
ncbi:hypothetical protein AKO1_007976 [Acrasis kona]|uniref:E3 ubiquitin-protein ligase CHFR n=1 Tax=Acrasis kona TaxID=1008807 RepID=A0AAW2YPJ3_9EUKA